MILAPDHRGERILDLDITAMIDVVFLLIIFFMTTAQFARMTRAEVELPIEPGDEERAGVSPGMVVNLTASGEFIVDDRSLPLERVISLVAAEVAKSGAGEIELWVRADRAAPAIGLNRLAGGLANLGVRNWRLATQAPPHGE